MYPMMMTAVSRREENSWDEIDEAIGRSDGLLLILSRESMTSEWVSTEIAKARKKEVTQKR